MLFIPNIKFYLFTYLEILSLENVFFFISDFLSAKSRHLNSQEKLRFQQSGKSGRRDFSKSTSASLPQRHRKIMRIILNAIAILLTVHWSHGSIVGVTNLANVSDSGKF